MLIALILFISDLYDVISLHWVFCEQVENKEKLKKKKKRLVWVKQVRKEKQAKILK